LRETIAGLIGSYGYVVLFLLVGLESLGMHAGLRAAGRRPRDHGRPGQPALPWGALLQRRGGWSGLLWLSACISGLEVARRWRAGAPPTAAPPAPAWCRPLERSARASLIA